MKKAILIYFLLLNHTILANYCWESKANVGFNDRYAAMGFDLNGKGYVGCGYNSGGKNDFWEYDPNANTWTQKANYIGGYVWAGVGFSIGSKGYIGLGTSGSSWPSTIYEYNPSTNSWTAKASLPFGIQDCYGFSINNYGYVACGWRSGTYYNSLYKFDPVANTWTTQAPFPGMVRDGIRGFTIGNSAYAGTGNLNGTTFSDFYKYNSLSNTWTSIANLPGNSRHSAIGFQLNGKGIFGGGSNANNSISYTDIYSYDNITNTWIPIIAYPGNNISYNVTFNAGGNGYVATGRKVSIGQDFNETWMLRDNGTTNFQVDSLNCQNTINLNNLSTATSNPIWYFGDGTTSTQISPSHTYATTGNYTISLVNGTGACKDSVTHSIVINISPLLSFSVTSQPCDLNISITNNSSGATNFTWLWGDGQQSTGINPTHSYINDSTYQITLIGSNGICSDTINQTIFVSGIVNSTFTIQKECKQEITITNSSTTNANYLWSMGDNNTINGNLTNYTYLQPGNYTVTLIAQVGTCSDTNTQTIQIDSSLIVNFTITNDCNNGISLSNNSNNAQSFIINWGDGNSTNTIIPQYQYSSSGNYQVKITASNQLCTDSTIYNVTAQTTSPAVINYVLSNCHDTVTLNSQNSAIQYNWDLGDGNTSQLQSLTHAYPIDTLYSITLITHNQQCSDTSTIQLQLPGTPNSDFTYSSSCNKEITLVAQQSSTWFYQWDLGDQSTSSTYQTTHIYNVDGDYKINLTINNGFCIDSTYKIVHIENTPDYTILYELDSCSRDVHFNISPEPSIPTKWYMGHNTTYTGNNLFHQFEASTIYNITAITEPGSICADTISLSLDLTSINYLNSIYIQNCFTPNSDGSNDKFKISEYKCDNIKMAIYTRWGTKIFETSNLEEGWNGKANNIDCPDGIYLLLLQGSNMNRSFFITLIR